MSDWLYHTTVGAAGLASKESVLERTVPCMVSWFRQQLEHPMTPAGAGSPTAPQHADAKMNGGSHIQHQAVAPTLAVAAPAPTAALALRAATTAVAGATAVAADEADDSNSSHEAGVQDGFRDAFSSWVTRLQGTGGLRYFVKGEGDDEGGAGCHD